ncbi:hypothetical protein J0B02_17045 [Enterobacteriaceae bacterium YMB-R22]|jgi:hypothetical protein|uniref:Uncharacterized protein n=2 Tax=Tenebrionibacter/Tenebrionicola group TaxID=2969848 RepID=A0A8K0XXS1_9ENTR|nr:hypothetical protein [Tenebrionibacter intestinalis]MBV4414498.1 hypothetical protein [Tenebrionicola larvae]MBV5097315.1 hypothetical protein [Tenebrionicola larvae]
MPGALLFPAAVAKLKFARPGYAWLNVINAIGMMRHQRFTALAGLFLM